MITLRLLFLGCVAVFTPGAASSAGEDGVPPPTSLELKLVATITEAAGGGKAVIKDTSSGELGVYREGDYLAVSGSTGPVRVVRVSRCRVVIERGDRRELLTCRAAPSPSYVLVRRGLDRAPASGGVLSRFRLGVGVGSDRRVSTLDEASLAGASWRGGVDPYEVRVVGGSGVVVSSGAAAGDKGVVFRVSHRTWGDAAAPGSGFPGVRVLRGLLEGFYGGTRPPLVDYNVVTWSGLMRGLLPSDAASPWASPFVGVEYYTFARDVDAEAGRER